MTTQLKALHAFALELIEGAFEGGSFDGYEIGDIAVKHGLIAKTEVRESCGEVCRCAEFYDTADFDDGVDCYSHTELMDIAGTPPCQ